MSLARSVLQFAFIAAIPLSVVGACLAVAPSTPEPEGTDWVLVLDRSGSMRGASMERARSAAHALLEELGLADRFALVTVGEHARVDLALTLDRDRWAAAVDRVEAGGGTDLGGGLALAATQHRPGSERSARTLVVTDGLPHAYDDLHGAVRAGVEAGARLDAIGVGGDVDAALLRSLAATGGGSYSSVEADGLAAVLRAAPDAVAVEAPTSTVARR